jgi:hypothetical protein
VLESSTCNPNLIYIGEKLAVGQTQYQERNVYASMVWMVGVAMVGVWRHY